MTDKGYRAWVRRLETFMARIKPSPEVKTADFECAPAMTNAAVRRLSGQLRLPIPDRIAQFLLEASAGLKFSYKWEAPSELVQQQNVEEFGSYDLYGGTAICVQESFAANLQRVADMAEEGYLLGVGRDQGMKFFPFAPASDGDLVALDASVSTGEMPVVYISFVQESPCTVIAPSLDSFLTEWEGLCYSDLYMARYSLTNPDPDLGDSILLPYGGSGPQRKRTCLLDSKLHKVALLRRLLGVDKD